MPLLNNIIAMPSSTPNPLRVMEHDKVKDELADYLREYKETPVAPDDATVEVEKPINIPGPSGRRPDVRLDADIKGYQGLAFEVKTRETGRTALTVARQMADDLRGGYQPVLVSPGWIFADGERRCQGHSDFTLKNVIRSQSGKILEVVSPSPIRFSPYSISQELDVPGLGDFFIRTTL